MIAVSSVSSIGKNAEASKKDTMVHGEIGIKASRNGQRSSIRTIAPGSSQSRRCVSHTATVHITGTHW